MTATREQRKRRKIRKRDRCEASGKIRLASVGETLLFVERGECRSFYRCSHCGDLHISKRRRTQ